MGRRALVEAKTALAGEMLDSSFARSRSPMTSFNFDKLPSRPVCRWDVGTILGIRSSYDEMKVVRGSLNPNPNGR